MKYTYLIWGYCNKNIFRKRKILYAYYQDSKEQNIVIFLILLGITIFCYLQKTQAEYLNSSLGAITTIVLFDTVIDKWKNKFHRKEIEFDIIKSLFFDIMVISNQLSNNRVLKMHIKSKIITSDNFSLILYYYKSTNNKKFIKIIDRYINLSKDFISFENFNSELYLIENDMIGFLINYE
jgi:hypothetical protein